ncbi:MAG: sulfotransferase family protein [Nocardioidaceae bacterium]
MTPAPYGNTGVVADDPRNPLGFVVGCPRSGTTLLQRMLAAHPALIVLPEVPWLATAPADRSRVNASGMVEAGFLRELAAHGAFGRYAHLPVAAGELLDLAARVDAGETVPFRTFVSWLLDRYGAAHGADLVVNKTVGAAVHVDALATTFPQASIVSLVRDGRDVVTSAIGWRRAQRLSEKYATWRHEPLGTAALWWEWHVRRSREAGRELWPDRFHEVRYEELVRWPAATLSGICAFLGLDYDDAMLDYGQGRRREDSSLDAKHGWQQVTVGLRDWRRQLGPDSLAMFDAVAGDLLAELGYPDSHVAPSDRHVATAEALRARFEGRPLPRRWGPSHDGWVAHPAPSRDSGCRRA